MPTWPGKKAFSAPNSEISICLTSVANELRLINKIPYFGSFTFLKAQALVVHYSPPPALLHRITHSNPSPSGKGQEGKGKDATPECLGFPGGSDFKESACSAENLGSIPGSERSPGERNGCPLQYSGLGNPMDRGAWQATVHGVTKSWTVLCKHLHAYPSTSLYIHSINF